MKAIFFLTTLEIITGYTQGELVHESENCKSITKVTLHVVLCEGKRRRGDGTQSIEWELRRWLPPAIGRTM